MPSLPRLALATSATDPEPSPACIALLGGLTELGWRVQHFRSWACPLNTQIIGPVTGLPGRHLDSWLMPVETCRAVFNRGALACDLAIVEGTLEIASDIPTGSRCDIRALSERHGPLNPMIDALDLPVVAVVDCRGWTERHLPWIPPDADAVILDGVSSREQCDTLRSMVRLLLNIPVLGCVEELPALRQGIADLPPGQPLPRDWVDRLASSFLRRADVEAIRALASSRPAPCSQCCHDAAFSCESMPLRRQRVAYAMDEVFGGYFPDTLETLELLGADLVEFSPLRDEALPQGADLVMIGCGFPDQYAEELASNLSLIAALRYHACSRGRIYSEGGGTAYLARTLILGDRQVPGAGVLPFDAVLQSPLSWPDPVERTLARDGWLGARGQVVRGYRSKRWSLRPVADLGDCPANSGPLTDENDIVFNHNAVGSLIHLHMAALPDVVAGFVGSLGPRKRAERPMAH